MTLRSAMRGQVTLSFVLLISGIVIEIALAGSFLVYALSTSRMNEKLSFRARTVAEAGIRDAQLRIARNKEVVQTTSPFEYVLPVGDDRANVTLLKTYDGSTSFYVYTITSRSIISQRRKAMQAVLHVDAITGVLSVISLNEISF